MRKLLILIIILIGAVSLFAQPRKQGKERLHGGQKPIYIEAHLIPSDTFSVCYISYKVPYSNLVFVKQNNTYKGGLIFRIEATGHEGVLARESTHDKVSLNYYEETNKRDKYLEGVLSLELKTSSATINPLIELDNTDRQVPLRPFKIENKNAVPMVVTPISNCEDSHGYAIINFENSIPFDDEDYELLIPIFDTDINKVTIKITQDEKEIILEELPKLSTLSVGLEKCGNNIVLTNNPANNAANLFVLNNFSRLLNEGTAEITIYADEDSTIYTGEIEVNWINKPMTLMNPKFAFELLELMESEDNLDAIYENADGDYAKAIMLFWEKYDPNKTSVYNQLMYEFYTRADKAIREYSSTGERFGVLTDRAKIYIKYGKPSEVDRYYSEKNEITEIWKYLSPKIEFVFVDETGLGNYKLVN